MREKSNVTLYLYSVLTDSTCLYSTVVVHTAANEREVSIRWLKHRVMFYIFCYRALKLSCSLAEYSSCYVDNAEWWRRRQRQRTHAGRTDVQFHILTHLTVSTRTSSRSADLRRSIMVGYLNHSNSEDDPGYYDCMCTLRCCTNRDLRELRAVHEHDRHPVAHLTTWGLSSARVSNTETPRV